MEKHARVCGIRDRGGSDVRHLGEGASGIDCVEAGGRSRGRLRRARNILMLEAFQDLGSCDPAAMTSECSTSWETCLRRLRRALRKGFAEKIVIVVSEELMLSMRPTTSLSPCVRMRPTESIWWAWWETSRTAAGAARPVAALRPIIGTQIWLRPPRSRRARGGIRSGPDRGGARASIPFAQS